MECSCARAASSFRNSGKRAAASTAFLTCTGRLGWARLLFPLCPRKGWSMAGGASERLLPLPTLLPCRTLPKARKEKKEKKKQHSVYWTHKVFVQQLDAVYRNCVQSCSSQYSDCAGRYFTNPTVLSPTWPASVAFFISHLSPGYVLFSCSSDEKNMWAGKESRERIIWIYLMK